MCKIYFNVILPSTLTFPVLPFPLRNYPTKILYTSHLSPVPYFMRVACIYSSKHDYVYNISIKEDAKSLHSVLVGLEVWWYPEMCWTLWTAIKSLLPIGIERLLLAVQHVE